MEEENEKLYNKVVNGFCCVALNGVGRFVCGEEMVNSFKVQC